MPATFTGNEGKVTNSAKVMIQIFDPEYAQDRSLYFGVSRDPAELMEAPLCGVHYEFQCCSCHQFEEY